MRSVGNKLGAILFFAGVLTLSAAAWSATPKGKVSLSERTERLADLVNSAVPESGRRTLTGPNEDGIVRVQQVDEGYVRNLASPGRTYFPVRGEAQNAEAVARGFLSAQQDLLLNRTDQVQFVTKRVKTLGAYSFVRLAQQYQGVPVWGAEMVVQVFGTRGVSYVASDLMRDTSVLDSGALSTQPSLDAKRAIELAIAAFPEYKPETLDAETPQLTIYAPSVLGQEGEPRLVWKMDVVSLERGNFQQCVLVDAHTGEIALKFNQVRNLLRRDVYDAKNQVVDMETYFGGPARFEGDPPIPTSEPNAVDVNQAYDYLGDCYTFYMDHYGRDSINDEGMTLRATVRYRDVGETAWHPDIRRMVIGTDYARDDVMAHEYTHGVTQYESNLAYLNESGAMNEAFSDIWGEWIDLTNGAGNDSPAVRWEMGEDLPGGAIRNLKEPGQYTDYYPELGVSLPMPDRYNSPNYYRGAQDNGGVHHNSSVASKLAYLLTDGDTFNHYQVEGLGIDTAAQLFWIVQSQLLTEGSDHKDLYAALIQAATYLGLDIQNVLRACLAVEIVPTSYMQAYKITYSNCDMTVMDGVSLLIENCAANATVNIQKIERFPTTVQLTDNYDFIKPGLIYMASGTIPLVEVRGGLRRFQTQARIFSLEVAGTIDTLVANGANIASISAAAIRSVSISDQLPGPRTLASIKANGNPVPDKFGTIKVNLKGVTLREINTPNQAAVISASSKKVQEGGVLVYVARADLSGVNVGDSLTASVTGGNVVGDMVARGVVKKVSATPISYTREGVTRVYGGYVGDPDVDWLYTNEERVLMTIWDHQVWIAGGEKGWGGSSSYLVGTVSAPRGILAYVTAGYDQYPEFPTFAGKVNLLSTKTPAAGSQGLWGILAKNAATKVKLGGDPTAIVAQRIRLFENVQQQPADNDNLAGARALSGVEGVANGSNVWATAELNEPDHEGLPAKRSVWWRWTAPQDGAIKFSTLSSRFYTVLSIYTGSSYANLAEVPVYDQSGSNYRELCFATQAGQSYLICVDGNPNQSDAEVGTRAYRSAGQGYIHLKWEPVDTPVNDNFSSAANLDAFAGTMWLSTLMATREQDEPDHMGLGGSASVWYTLQFDYDFNVELFTKGSSYQAVVAAYTGGSSLGDLLPVDANEGSLAFAAEANKKYYIAIDGEAGQSEMGRLQLSWVARPSNDNFDSPTTMTGTTGMVMGNNSNATIEDEETGNQRLGLGASVWWRYTTPASMTSTTLVFSTAGSDFDTALVVYQGNSLWSLRRVAYNDNSSTMPLVTTSQVKFVPAPGANYMICVCGPKEIDAPHIGKIRLSWQPQPQNGFAAGLAAPMEGIASRPEDVFKGQMPAAERMSGGSRVASLPGEKKRIAGRSLTGGRLPAGVS